MPRLKGLGMPSKRKRATAKLQEVTDPDADEFDQTHKPRTRRRRRARAAPAGAFTMYLRAFSRNHRLGSRGVTRCGACFGYIFIGTTVWSFKTSSLEFGALEFQLHNSIILHWAWRVCVCE
jgi:hypothetical protein